MPIRNKDREQLIDALEVGYRKAFQVKAENSEDGGTCNFDAVLVRIDNCRFSTFKKIVEECNATRGVAFRVEKWDRYDGIWAMLEGVYEGQAALRTRMAVALRQTLSENVPLGVRVAMHYACD